MTALMAYLSRCERKSRRENSAKSRQVLHAITCGGSGIWLGSDLARIGPMSDMKQQASGDLSKRPLFIYEMANNHMGDVAHGIRIVQELKEVSSGFDFGFCVKLQYRDIDACIHPDYQLSLIHISEPTRQAEISY